MVMKTNKNLGSASLTPSGDIEVGSSHAFVIKYRVGENGIRQGGGVRIEVPGQLGWSRPHVVGNNEAEGIVEVSCSRKDIRFSTAIERVTRADFTQGWQTLRWIVVSIEEGSLKEGDEITVFYGPHRYGYGVGVKTTIHAYSRDRNWEEFTVCVDPDGKSGFHAVARSPGVNMIPSTFMCYEALLPSIGVVGGKVALKITAWDRFYNPCTHHEASLQIRGLTNRNVRLQKRNKAVLDLKNLSLSGAGVLRFEILDRKNGVCTRSNPVVVHDKQDYRIFWGDIHLHTCISIDNKHRDRMLYTPEHYCEYAREVTGLDFIGFTDHHEPWHADHGLTDGEWERTVSTANRYTKAGKFVALIGFEFRDRRGDTNVHFSGDNPTRVPPEINRVSKLWEYYRRAGEEAITIPHLHPYSNYERSGAPDHRSPGYDVAWHSEDWDVMDPHFEMAVEVCSTWGRYEYYRNAPHSPPSGMLKGHSIQNLLARGHRLGIVASSDGHKGSPGNCCLVAVYAKELSRKAIFAALQSRFCYGVTHARIALRFEINGARMGSETRTKGDISLVVEVHGVGRIYSVEIIKNNEPYLKKLGEGEMDLVIEHRDQQQDPLAYYYARVMQEDGEMAWSSPIWVEKIFVP